MAFQKENYSAVFFKKDKRIGENDSSENDKTKAVMISSQFNREDKVIAKLYRKVVDDIYEDHSLTESKVNKAIRKYKENLNIAHRRGFRRFEGINFNKPINTCSYLRRYAVPYTGLVKKAMSDFFKETRVECVVVKTDILQSEFLKVISLGGGPGNDLVGFCSAIHESPNTISKLELTVIDMYSGWSNVFSAVVEKAKKEKLGSFSNLVKSVDVTTGFVCEDLTLEATFDDKNFASNVGNADVVLMVKFLSFLQEPQRWPLLLNVAKIMTAGAILVYVDCCKLNGLFKHIRSLQKVYDTHLQYQLDFNPKRFHCKTVALVKAYVHIFQKDDIHSQSISYAICEYIPTKQIELDVAENSVTDGDMESSSEQVDTATADDTSTDDKSESDDVDNEESSGSSDDVDNEEGSGSSDDVDNEEGSGSSDDVDNEESSGSSDVDNKESSVSSDDVDNKESSGSNDNVDNEERSDDVDANYQHRELDISANKVTDGDKEYAGERADASTEDDTNADDDTHIYENIKDVFDKESSGSCDGVDGNYQHLELNMVENCAKKYASETEDTSTKYNTHIDENTKHVFGKESSGSCDGVNGNCQHRELNTIENGDKEYASEGADTSTENNIYTDDDSDENSDDLYDNESSSGSCDDVGFNYQYLDLEENAFIDGDKE